MEKNLGEVRSEVAEVALAMEMVLSENDNKLPYTDCSLGFLIFKIHECLGKLNVALATHSLEEVPKEILDTMNYLMFARIEIKKRGDKELRHYKIKGNEVMTGHEAAREMRFNAK